MFIKTGTIVIILTALLFANPAVQAAEPTTAIAATAADSGTSVSPDGSASVSAVATPVSDKTNYKGDRIKFPFARRVCVVDMTKAEKSVTEGCAPALTTLRGIGTLTIDGKASPAFVVTNVPEESTCGATSTPVKVKDVIVIEQADIDAIPPDRYGLTYGTLLVPYKYHLSGSKSFGSSASVGGYLGYRQERSGWWGLGLQYVGFLGAASIPVPQITNGTTTTQNMTGVSYGVGLLGTVKDSFHMGFILGADRVNSSAGYVDNGKPWIAVELGYAFSN